MTAFEVMNQNNGDVTTEYYRKLGQFGSIGRIAVALFRAQKRSSRAKEYRRSRWRHAAYDVKQWSMDQLCHELIEHGGAHGIPFGWKEDPKVLFGERSSWVLYVDLPGLGQVSFHSPNRGAGPDYPGQWTGDNGSASRICKFCDDVTERMTPCPPTA